MLPSPVPPPPTLQQDVPLAPHCTLHLGGPARHFLRATSEEEIVEALRWAAAHDLPVTPLGGGSNVVIADRGIDGLVLQVGTRGLAIVQTGELALITAQAGEPWDELVALTVARGLAGLECLSGIPGLVGATPIQNVGAYGQEIGDTLRSVRVLDRDSLSVTELPARACDLRYRDSRFKDEPGRYLVLAATFALLPGGAPTLRYPELARELADEPPTLAAVREAVLRLRRRKSMVLDPRDENRHSAGSFFMNPVLAAEEADEVLARAAALGLAEPPRYPQPDGRVKLAAGWLIEAAGLRKGQQQGAVGISSRHALALVHHGGGTAEDLIALAAGIQRAVHGRFGVWLRPEPVFLGFSEDALLALRPG